MNPYHRAIRAALSSMTRRRAADYIQSFQLMQEVAEVLLECDVKCLSHIQAADKLHLSAAILSHRGTGEDPLHFWVAMNAVYSDLGPVLAKYGLDAPGTCADFACAFWLHDKDAVEDKLAAYYGCVVRHTIR